LSAFPAFAEWQDKITQYMFDNFVPSAGDTIHAYFTEFTANAGKATAISILVLLFSVISLMMSIEDAFNRIWRVPTGRPLTSRLLMYWAVLTAGPILMVGALAISSYVFALPMLAQAGESFQIKARLLGILPFLISWFMLTAIYVLVPNCRVRLRHAVIGALIAAIASELAKRGFTSYVGKSYNQVYGALAIIPMFIVWIYLSWIVVLVGASVASTLAAFDYRPNAPKLPAGDEFRGLVRVLAHFASAQRTGAGLSADELRRREPFLSDASTQQYLGDLVKAGLIQRSERGDFILARDLATTSLYDLYAASGYRIPLHEPLPVTGDVSLDAAATSKLGEAANGVRATLDTPLAEIFPATVRSNA
ncbi:YihY family inner membrane protein, partial [Rudaea sp.]|uniref:YihY family inner membrane protein n=1 Tax=Rudaea sp. TaxID=2136325 RepID=UPI002ED35006